MSRIGRMPVEIPSAVQVTVSDQQVTVKGPKGELSIDVAEPIAVEVADNEVRVERPDDERRNKQLHGLTRTLVNNMVIGVVEGYKKEIVLKGVGFRAVLNGNVLDLALGYSHPCLLTIPEGITVQIAENTKLTIEGADKHLVGEVTATIFNYYPAEPYKGKGVHIVGKYVRHKEGKKSA